MRPADAEPEVATRLGGGSDHTVCWNFLGVPVADLSFDGPYGVCPSICDGFTWMDRVGRAQAEAVRLARAFERAASAVEAGL
jgi:hypothetical protein